MFIDVKVVRFGQKRMEDILPQCFHSFPGRFIILPLAVIGRSLASVAAEVLEGAGEECGRLPAVRD